MLSAPYPMLFRCLKAFSLRSPGVVGNADPPTSRPGGPNLKLARGVAVSTGGAYASNRIP
jgi:hypothetical protein